MIYQFIYLGLVIYHARCNLTDKELSKNIKGSISVNTKYLPKIIEKELSIIKDITSNKYNLVYIEYQYILVILHF